MRRLIKYAALSIAALLFAGCEVDLNPDSGNAPEKECIVLRLGSAPLSVTTKAGSERGTNYNESLIESVDLFFYPEGGTGSNAVMTAIGRSVEAKNEADSTVYLVKVHYTAAQAASLFGSTTGGTCQVYVIANANFNYGSDTRVESLKKLTVERDFSMTEQQSSFVMSSEEIETVTQALDGSGDPYATGRVHMKRAAAKAQLFLRFLESIPDSSDPNRRWKPDLDGTHGSTGVYVDLLNISKKGCLDATYTVQDDDYTSCLNHHASPRTSLPAFYPAIDAAYDDYDYAATPFYTYPISWSDIDEHACSYIIHIPWYPEDYNSGTETWIAHDAGYRTYQVNANVVGLKMERNHCYRTFVYIKSLGGVDKEQIAVIPECDYYICPWNFESTSAGNGIVAGSFSDYKYLVVDNPEMTINNEEDVIFTYVSSSPIKETGGVVINKIIYYNYALVNPIIELEPSDGTSFESAKNQIDINQSTPGMVKFTHSLTDVYVQWEVFATITNEDNISEDVHFLQNPPIYMGEKEGGNVFVNGYFGHVTGADSSKGWIAFTDSDGTYYMSASYDGLFHYIYTQWGNSYIGSSYSNTINNTNSYFALVDSDYSYGPVVSWQAYSHKNCTKVMISSFNENNKTFLPDGLEYKISDPRVSWTSPSLNNYLISQTNRNNNASTMNTGSWDSIINKIKISSEEKELIAPSFIISSGWGQLYAFPVTSEYATKRCATYQEGGYPAGRWRVPTEAEVAFVISRQADGSIPTLFSDGVDYWASSGRYYNTNQFYTPSDNNRQCFLRCVYDTWFWGEDPVEEAKSSYYPAP